MVDVTKFEGNYLNGQYVGVFSEEKPFGPHVRKCVCKPCHATFLAEHKAWKEQCAAEDAKLDPAVLAEREAAQMKMVDEILAEIKKNPTPKRTPSPAKVEVGSRVVIRTQGGVSMNEGRIGTVVEMPGPSVKYDGRNAERIEVFLESTVDHEEETMWTDNNQWGWLEIA